MHCRYTYTVVYTVQYRERIKCESKSKEAYSCNEGDGNARVGLDESDEHLSSDVDEQVCAQAQEKQMMRLWFDTRLCLVGENLEYKFVLLTRFH